MMLFADFDFIWRFYSYQPFDIFIDYALFFPYDRSERPADHNAFLYQWTYEDIKSQRASMISHCLNINNSHDLVSAHETYISDIWLIFWYRDMFTVIFIFGITCHLNANISQNKSLSHSECLVTRPDVNFIIRIMIITSTTLTTKRTILNHE